FLLVGVAAERPRHRELAQLVPDHVLGHEHVHEDPPVVDLEGVPDELRDDRAATRPCLDELALVLLVELLHPAVELLNDVRTFLQTPAHGASLDRTRAIELQTKHFTTEDTEKYIRTAEKAFPGALHPTLSAGVPALPCVSAFLCDLCGLCGEIFR